jgi:membrane-bound lytic murein transglycosylase D
MKGIFLIRIRCAGLAAMLASFGLLQIASPIAAQQAPTPASPTPQAQRQQQLQQLIQKVNEAYAAGDADYRKGRLTEAKTEFDNAVDLMLSSGFDIKNNPALEAVFNRIVDDINSLEMDALKQGTGFAPPIEPAPGDVASDITFGSVDPNIIAKAKTQLATTKSDLPLVVNEYVAAFINFFANTQKGHNTLLHSFQRGGRYRAMIQRVMAEEGVPQDLIYLAVAESGFQPRAVNPRSRAGGMWQFMPVGEYGLERNTYVDERFDPEKSTRAYARYMKFLYDQLGDWYLAMAAYDWGAGNVQRAVQKTGYADFWELYKRNNLPGETKNYVPQILAAIIVANNPKQYGFEEVTLDPPVLTDTVSVNYALDIRLVSDIVNAPIDEIQALNPSLLRMTTPPDASFDLHLPAGAAELFQKRIALIPQSHRNAWRYHHVGADDTLASIAHSFRISESDLAETNQLREGQSLTGVEGVVVPVAPVIERSAHAALYTVRRGDTLVSIADRFGVSLDQLRSWNGIASGVKVAAGRKLHVAEPASGASRSGSRRTRGATSGTSKPGKSRVAAASGTHQHATSSANRNGKTIAKKQK